MKSEGFVVGQVALWLVDIKLDDLCLDFRGKGDKVPIHVERTVTSMESKIARVTIEKTLKVLLKSVLRWLWKISDQLTDYIIEPEGDLDVIMSRTLHLAGLKPKYCVKEMLQRD